MAQFEKHFVQDLTQDIKIRQCGTIVFNGDNLSNVITVDLYNGTEPYSGGGSVSCSVICPDGATVPITNGSISGNTVTVTLTGDCFAIPGQIGVGVQVVSGDIRTTILKAIYNVELLETDTIVDPGSRITASVGQLVSDIENAVAQIPASDMASLMAGIAPTFSASTNYTAGAYVYYNGTLYRFTADHAAGSWTGTDATEAALANDVDDLKSAVVNPPPFSIIRNGKVYGNLWDEDTKAYGYYDTTSTNLGVLIEGGTSWYYSPTYIPVNVGDVIVYNNSRPIVCAYDALGNVVACSQPGWSGYTVPSGVAFLRFSVTVASANGMCIFVNGTNQLEYKQKTQLCIPNLIIKKPTITVAANGDYTSLTKALYATADDHPDVFVKVGTYDIVAEYKALFGNDIFDTMTYATEGMKNFQWGLYIDNRTVTFAAGAKVVCDMSAYTNDGTRRFSPFNLGMNAVIDGLDCYAVNPYYIIHDDFGDASEAFTNVIRNCVLITPEASQGNVIGGGCRMYSTKVVDNCYLDNGNNKPVAMRYHNTNVNGATPVVIIKNTRANSKIRLNYYGTQNTKMTAFVNNCKALAIEKAAETEGSTDNVTLYEWCNEVGS